MSDEPIKYEIAGEWAAHPARNCRGLDRNMFMVERGDTATLDHLRSICDGCPVKVPCAEFAINDATIIGIWGGLSGKERRDLRRQRRLENGEKMRGPRRGTVVKVARCGTLAGYERHRRQEEPTCAECRAARAAYKRYRKDNAA